MQSQDLNPRLVVTVEVKVKSDQAKDFLQFNKRVLNVVVRVRKLQIHVVHVMEKEKHNQMSQFL